MNASDLMLPGGAPTDTAKLSGQALGGSGPGPRRSPDAVAGERAGGAAAFASELRGARGEAGAGGAARMRDAGAAGRGGHDPSTRSGGGTEGRSIGDGSAPDGAAAARGDGAKGALASPGTEDARPANAASAPGERGSAAAVEVVGTGPASTPDGVAMPAPLAADDSAATTALPGGASGDGVPPGKTSTLVAPSGTPARENAVGFAGTGSAARDERVGDVASAVRGARPDGTIENASVPSVATHDENAAVATPESRDAGAATGAPLASTGDARDGAFGVGGAASGGTAAGTPAAGAPLSGAPSAEAAGAGVSAAGAPGAATIDAEASAAETPATGTAASDTSTANAARREDAAVTTAVTASVDGAREATGSGTDASRPAEPSAGGNLTASTAREGLPASEAEAYAASGVLPSASAAEASAPGPSIDASAGREVVSRGDLATVSTRSGGPATIPTGASVNASALASRADTASGAAALAVAGTALGANATVSGTRPPAGTEGEASAEPSPVLVADVVRERRVGPTRRVEVSRLENEVGVAAERRPGSPSLDGASLAAAREGESTASRSAALSSAASVPPASFALPAPGATPAVRVDAAAVPSPAATPIAPHNVSLGTGGDAGELAAGVRWTLGEGRGLALVNVTPAGLGPVSIRVSLEGEQMNVSILAAQPGAREALEALVPRLREQLSAEGHERVQVDVSSGRQDGQGRAGAHARDEGQSGTGRATGGNEDGHDVESLARPESTTHDGTRRDETIARSLIDAWA